MPAKSKHGKGKHPRHSRKSKAIQRQAAPAVKQEVQAGTAIPPVAADATPALKAKAEPAKTKTIQNPFIVSELRNIGILAGIILVVLVLLAVFLS
jgi:hypothetical protein